jgi:hypothetical protein
MTVHSDDVTAGVDRTLIDDHESSNASFFGGKCRLPSGLLAPSVSVGAQRSALRSQRREPERDHLETRQDSEEQAGRQADSPRAPRGL